MSTVLEALQNAQYNFENGLSFTHQLAKIQLKNAVELLEKGYGVDDDVEELIEQFGDVESVPEK